MFRINKRSFHEVLMDSDNQNIIRIVNIVNIVKKKCYIAGCEKDSTYGILYTTATRCKDHKTGFMVKFENQELTSHL